MYWQHQLMNANVRDLANSCSEQEALSWSYKPPLVDKYL